MPVLRINTGHHFKLGTVVRIKRHGLKCYEGTVMWLEKRTITVRISGIPYQYQRSGDYAVVATGEMPWTEIPHPQSPEWYYMKDLPSLPCELCSGTGMREYQSGALTAITMGQCASTYFDHCECRGRP